MPLHKCMLTCITLMCLVSLRAVSNTQPLAQQSPTLPEEKHTITLRSAITAEDLAYKHMTGTYKPREFKVEIGGKKLVELKGHTLATQPITVSYAGDTLNIVCEYMFKKGFYRRQSRKLVKVRVTRGAQELTIGFSWHDENRIRVLQGGSVISSIDINK